MRLTDSVRRDDDEGRCGPAATRGHLQHRRMALRHFLHLHQFPFCAAVFIAAGVKNNVYNKKPNPGVQRISNKELRNNRSYFARQLPFESSGIPRKAGTFTNFHLCPNGGICLCSHLLFRGFFSPSLSTTFPRYNPPFLWSPPEQGAQ